MKEAMNSTYLSKSIYEFGLGEMFRLMILSLKSLINLFSTSQADLLSICFFLCSWRSCL